MELIVPAPEVLIVDCPLHCRAKLDLLLVGDVAVHYLADTVQKFFSNIADLTITLSDVNDAATLLDDCMFDIVFLKMTSLLTAEELEAVKSIRFSKKKNTHLLFVFIIPENFKGCISGHGADVTLTEPLTMEKMNIVVKYWRTCFTNTVKNESAARPEEPGLPLQSSCSEHLGYFPTDLFTCSESLRNDTGLELKAPVSDFDKGKKISLLHSSKEKLRRERIKYCCEQLRTLLPYTKGRKNDTASVLEATVDYVKCIREKLPPAIMDQIAEAFQSNKRFCKKQKSTHPSLPGSVMLQWYEQTFGSPNSDGRCQSSSISESAVSDLYKTQIPNTALSLNSFHAVRYYSKVIPAYDAAAITNQNLSIHLPPAVPKVSKFLPQHCNSMPGQTCTTHPNCLVSLWGSEGHTGFFLQPQKPLTYTLLLLLWLEGC
uniref:Spermatogenesis- and oogenesis-specific basic helix-loop-helix-containing protein 2 n=1 Tax=Castor canadensis TaxID=51338 RepID=A0A8C0Y2U6_CASCN